MKRKMRLYVWEGVLTDYTDGVMVAVAPSVAEARKVLRAQHPDSSMVEMDSAQEPTEIDLSKPWALAVWGGG